MRKLVLSLIILILCVSVTFAEAPPVYPDVEEFKLVGIGISSVMYVAIAELYYMMGEEIPGMSGSMGFTGTDADIQWSDCDLGPVLDYDPEDAGSMVIDRGTHRVSLDGDTLTNRIDVTITYRQLDDINGTYRVEFETRTLRHDSNDEQEKIVAFTVNGKDIQASIDAAALL